MRLGRLLVATTVLVLPLVSGAGAVAPAGAAEGVEERLRSVEQRLAEQERLLREQLEQLRAEKEEIRRQRAELEAMKARPAPPAAAPAAAAEAPPFVFAYKPGKGFSITTPDGAHALTLGGRIQVRYTGNHRNDATDQSTFRIRRLRLWTEGHLVSPKFRYGFQGDFADDFELRDAYVELAHVEPAVLKLGQFKIPFNRQQVTSSGALQFVDRSITNDEFIFGDDGRDIGGMVHGEVVPALVAYQAGLFNGAGPNTTNEDAQPLVVGRVLVTPLGAFKDYYVEGDHLGTDTPRLGLGAAVGFDSNESAGRTVERRGLVDLEGFRGADVLGVTADAHFKYQGLAALADYHFRQVDPRGSTLEAFDAHGALAQVGYFLLPQTLEVAARYAWLDPNDAVRGDNQQEYGGAVGYFFSAHNLKVQLDLRNVDTGRPGRKDRHDVEGRAQVQAIF